jgi:hypothetical protein
MFLFISRKNKIKWNKWKSLNNTKRIKIRMFLYNNDSKLKIKEKPTKEEEDKIIVKFEPSQVSNDWRESITEFELERKYS